jgi:hypothetical protein
MATQGFRSKMIRCLGALYFIRHNSKQKVVDYLDKKILLLEEENQYLRSELLKCKQMNETDSETEADTSEDTDPC